MGDKFMKSILILSGAFLFIAIIAFSSFGGLYNRLVKERENARTQLSEIETDLQRRFDLVPNVVAATKGAMVQEKQVFENISKAYGAYMQAQAGTPEKMQAGDQLGSALRGYLVVVQQYPSLRSLDLVKDLTVTLEGTENRIATSRRRYNESVQVYNQHLLSFPTNTVAGVFGFEPMARFESVGDAKVAPKVDLVN